MTYTIHIANILGIIPDNKVMSYKSLADIFFVSPSMIKSLLEKTHHDNKYRVIPSKGQIDNITKKKLINKHIDIKKNTVPQEYFRKPSSTNYYVSLITKDTSCIEQFSQLSKKIALMHPNTIYKTPTHYHITLADCSNTSLSTAKINAIFAETLGLLPFHFHCLLHRPYVDTKKQKVVFWIRLQNNPFLLTLHKCLQKHIPRRSEKKYLPHITLGKIMKSTHISPKFDTLALDILCSCNTICITANIDSTKDIILFSKELN